MALPPKAKSSLPDPEDQSWIEHVQSDIQKAPERVENTAKYLVGIISISLSIFLSNRADKTVGWAHTGLVIAIAFWLLSALLGFFVLYPWRYSFNPDSPKDIRRAYRKITNTKKTLLVLSLVCFMVALVVACYHLLIL